jgi:hypothetical protein
LKNQPGLTQWTEHYYSGYMVLTSSRPMGMGGPGAIPLTEITAYLDLIGERDDDERMRWVRLIRSMDSVYLQHQASKHVG